MVFDTIVTMSISLCDRGKKRLQTDIKTNRYSFATWKDYTQNHKARRRKKRVKVVNKVPDNLLVQWVPGGKTITEIFREMNKDCRSVLYT